MNPITTAAVSEMMAAVTTLSGLPVLWKDPGGGSEPELPLEQCRHCNPFCAAVKAVPARLRRCSLNDSCAVAEAATGRSEPFIHRCHAGADELIVPVFDGSGVYAGAFFLGPFRGKDAACRCTDCRDEFAALPEYDPGRVAAAGRLLRLLELSLEERRQVLASRHLAGHAGRERLRPALECIERRYAEPLTAADVAAGCHLSVSRFLHVFREQCGTGFSDFLLRRRVEAARLLLSATGLRVGEIAFRCGFQSQSYFGQIFRRYTGMSPVRWRREHRPRQEP